MALSVVARQTTNNSSMKRTVRKATSADIDTVWQLIETGKATMLATGNTCQWDDSHPSRAQIEEDVARGISFLLFEGGTAVATWVLAEGPDPTYGHIDGAWIDDRRTYHVIHRVAGLPGRGGLMHDILRWCEASADNLRIDTHRDNAIMRHILGKEGFSYCGIINLENGDERLAFQKIKKDNPAEMLPMVDAEGNVLGSITRGHAHDGSHILHPVVHLHVFNSNGDIYLQHRPEWKDVQPGKWDTAVGGHVDYGETVPQALHREVKEELGITDFTPVSLGHYVFESKRERELVYVNRCTYDGPIAPSAEELNGGRFWTKEEIAESMGRGVLTPNFEQEYKRFFL